MPKTYTHEDTREKLMEEWSYFSICTHRKLRLLQCCHQCGAVGAGLRDKKIRSTSFLSSKITQANGSFLSWMKILLPFKASTVSM